MGIPEALHEVNENISSALKRSEEPGRTVKLIAVSKTFPPEVIVEALNAGLTSFGENRVQEISTKYAELSSKKIEWHFIGHLQTNKVRKLLDIPTALIHSVDRLELAVELDKQLQKRGESRDVLLEVNTSGEVSKSGVRPEEAIKLARAVAKLGTLRVKGLMTIGAVTEDPEVTRKCFVTLRRLYNNLKDENISGIEMVEMSIGMSGDYTIAIEEGSTIIRLGTALFGERRGIV